MLKEKALAELIAYTVKKFKLKALEEIGLRTAISKAYSDLLDRAENFGFKNEVFLPKLAEKNLLY